MALMQHFRKSLMFIFGCPGSLLLPARFSGCGGWGRLSSCRVWTSLSGAFLLWMARSRGTDFRRFGSGLRGCGSWALERRLTGGGAWAYLPQGMWGLPGSGTEPTSPALADGYPTAAPPGMPHCSLFASVVVCTGDGEWSGLQTLRLWHAKLNHLCNSMFALFIYTYFCFFILLNFFLKSHF